MGSDCVSFGSSFSLSLASFEVPKPKSFRVPRRLGLIGGIGGGWSMPFFREAPGGKSTVSTFEVDEIRVGSEMSDFEIVFLRSGAFGRADEGTMGEYCSGEKVAGLAEAGVPLLDAERGGVGLDVYGLATGAGRPGV